MTEFLLGALFVAVGLLLCLRGSLVLRLLIAAWAGLAGFLVGAGAMASVTGDSFLGGALAVVVALLVGAVFAAVAYLFFVVAILIAMAGFGFTLGTDLMVALGVEWSWLVTLAGAALGLLLGALALAVALPMAVLVVLSTLTGASMSVTGLMLWFGALQAADLGDVATTQRVADDWWWWLTYAVLAVVGTVVQLRLLPTWRTPIDAEWSGSRGSRVRV